MLATILIWAYTLITAGLMGWAGFILLQKLCKIEIVKSPSFGLLWLLGLAILTCIFSFLSLVMPLSLAAQLIVLGLSAILLFFWWRSHSFPPRNFVGWLRGQHPLAAILFVLAAVTVLILATDVPRNPDTGLYHAQTIRWIETYPAVPGLGNFHSRLGFNSSWLLTQALFSFAFIGIQSFHLNTSLLCLVAVFYFGAGIHSLWNGSRRFSDWARVLFLPLIFYVLSSEASSPGNDAPVALITWILAIEWLSFLEDGSLEQDLRPILLTLISVYAVTIKLSAIPLLVIGLIVLGRRLIGRHWRAPLFAAGLSVLFLAPWMARSVVQTGYLVYPFPAVDIFSVDWKRPIADVRMEAEIIRDWAFLPRQDVARVESLSPRALVTEWFANQTPNRRAILLIDLAAPFAFLLLSLVRKFRPFLGRLAKMAWPLWLTIYLGLIYWFFGAPDYRFGEGYIMAALVLAITPIIIVLQEKWRPATRYLPWLVIGILVVYQGYTLISSVDLKTMPQRMILPADYPTSSSQPCHTAGMTILIPADTAYGLCWYGLFPCTPNCNTGFELRGSSLQDGFRPKAGGPGN